MEDLHSELQSLSVALKDVGYIEPGHGVKGRQMWLETEDDLDAMYQIHDKKGKSEILLWCYMKVKTDLVNQGSIPYHQQTVTLLMTGSKRTSSAQKLQEVEKIVDDLRSKHAAKYSTEQLNAWAHLLHVGKHNSYETPPNLPYFGKRRGGTEELEKAKSIDIHVSCSPSKRLGLRGECIEQLSNWHALLDKGAISVQQYNDLKETILGDLFKLGTTD